MNRKNEDIDFIISNLLTQNTKVRRAKSDIDSRSNGILDEIVSDKIEEKTLPLALRKRLMYQRVLTA